MLFRLVASLPLQISKPAKTSVRYQLLENGPVTPLFVSAWLTASLMKSFRSNDRLETGESCAT